MIKPMNAIKYGLPTLLLAATTSAGVMSMNNDIKDKQENVITNPIENTSGQTKALGLLSAAELLGLIGIRRKSKKANEEIVSVEENKNKVKNEDITTEERVEITNKEPQIRKKANLITIDKVIKTLEKQRDNINIEYENDKQALEKKIMGKIDEEFDAIERKRQKLRNDLIKYKQEEYERQENSIRSAALLPGASYENKEKLYRMLGNIEVKIPKEYFEEFTALRMREQMLVETRTAKEEEFKKELEIEIEKLKRAKDEKIKHVQNLIDSVKNTGYIDWKEVPIKNTFDDEANNIKVCLQILDIINQFHFYNIDKYDFTPYIESITINKDKETAIKEAKNIERFVCKEPWFNSFIVDSSEPYIGLITDYTEALFRNKTEQKQEQKQKLERILNPIILPEDMARPNSDYIPPQFDFMY